jgi:hypothetical protein
MLRDDRGSSPLVTHVLTVGITAMLMIGLLASAGTFLQSQQEHSARQQLRDVGGDMSRQFVRLDQLHQDRRVETVALNTSHPGTLTGQSYTVFLERTPEPHLRLRMAATSLNVTVPLGVQTSVAESQTSPGSMTIYLCPYDGPSPPASGETAFTLREAHCA